jgi:2-iminoacetate synthase
VAPFPVGEAWLAQMIFAMRMVLPEVPLLLSTRERPAFRDGMAGLGISRMSVASRTTVGGYAASSHGELAQFEVSDERGVEEFCAMLRQRGLEPVFKNWDAVYRDPQ